MKLLSLIRQCATCPDAANRGELVPVRALLATGVDRQELADALLQEARWGNVSLHATDHAAGMTSDELQCDTVFYPDDDAAGCGVHPRGRYVLGVALRTKAPAGWESIDRADWRL